jgi:hypothetical protein
LITGPARVIASHDPAGGLAEADVVLGLRAGRAAFVASPSEVDAERVGALYR